MNIAAAFCDSGCVDVGLRWAARFTLQTGARGVRVAELLIHK